MGVKKRAVGTWLEEDVRVLRKGVPVITRTALVLVSGLHPQLLNPRCLPVRGGTGQPVAGRGLLWAG